MQISLGYTQGVDALFHLERGEMKEVCVRWERRQGTREKESPNLVEIQLILQQGSKGQIQPLVRRRHLPVQVLRPPVGYQLLANQSGV